MADALESGSSLAVGQKIHSANGRHYLEMQDDGNLVLATEGMPTWSANAKGSGAVRAEMQADGNFVLYKENSEAAWSSETSGKDGARLVLENDGNLCVRRGDSNVWASNTPQPEPAQSAPQAQAAPAAPATQTYTVVAGDTLSAIAKQFYGDANQYMKIAQASGVANPDMIHPGQVLTIPA